jgi:hypothetical protein
MHTNPKQMLLIRYSGDNDFISTLQLFANIIVLSGRLRPDASCVDQESSLLGREEIARHFNSIGDSLHEIHTGRPAKLRIGSDEIFWGDSEVKTKLETYSQWGNGDSVLIYPDGRIEIA